MRKGHLDMGRHEKRLYKANLEAAFFTQRNQSPISRGEVTICSVIEFGQKQCEMWFT
jgi:hypothetical protein